MTFVNHTAGGFAVGSAFAWLLWTWCGVDFWWTLSILGALIGAFPDVGSWVFWKLWPEKYQRWQVYSYCHPVPGGGQWDKWGRWLLPWGLHTWLVDSIIHPTQAKFVFPQFKMEWTDVIWVHIELSWGKNVIELTKWDVLYVALEAFLYVVYGFVIWATVI